MWKAGGFCEEAGDLSGAETPELTAAAEGYLSPEASGTVSVTVFAPKEDLAENPDFLVRWRNREKELFLMQKTETEGTVEYYKLYARDEWSGRRNVYESFNNERAWEIKTRRWPVYFRDRIRRLFNFSEKFEKPQKTRRFT